MRSHAPPTGARYDDPKEAWYGPQGTWMYHNGTGYVWEDDSYSTLTFQMYDLRNDPMETDNLWDLDAYRTARNEMVSLFCDAYLHMVPSVFKQEDTDPFLIAYRNNGNFTTWVQERSATHVYSPVDWSTPTPLNCTFGAFVAGATGGGAPPS